MAVSAAGAENVDEVVPLRANETGGGSGAITKSVWVPSIDAPPSNVSVPDDVTTTTRKPRPERHASFSAPSPSMRELTIAGGSVVGLKRDDQLDEVLGGERAHGLVGVAHAGALDAATLTAAAEALLAAYSDWQGIALRISALVGSKGGVRPADVSAARSDAAARAAQELIQCGGEEGPRLRRDRYPALVEQPDVETEHEHAVPV